MSGHSKWSTIKRKKAATDARRGKLFTRLLKEISVSARLEGGDPDFNPRLRAAIDDAKANNVPGENIERAVQRGTGELEGVEYEEVVYEGYAPGGVAVLVEAMTDNRNRTVSDLRNLFSRHGGNLGESGSVAWMFERRGWITLDAESMADEEAMELALEVGAEDISMEDEGIVLNTTPQAFHGVVEELRERGVQPLERELVMVSQSQIELAPNAARPTLRLLDALEDQEDVQNVWANLELEDEVLASQQE